VWCVYCRSVQPRPLETNTVFTVSSSAQSAIPLQPATWVSEGTPGAVGEVSKGFDNGRYEGLQFPHNTCETVDTEEWPPPSAPADSRSAPTVKPRPKPMAKPRKSADDNYYVDLTSDVSKDV